MVEDRNRRAVRAARELAHCATSLASEAATLARLFEPYSAAEPSVAASRASLAAAQASFALDDLVASGAAPLPEVFAHADAALDASIAAIQSAKAALERARHAAIGEGGASSAQG